MAKPVINIAETDGNVFGVIGAVERALKRNGDRDAALEFTAAALDCASYDAVLQLTMQYVDWR